MGIPEVNTKFMETHKVWLVKLLTCVLPKTAVKNIRRNRYFR
ncbi:MAG: hypothetical protein ABR513_04610 [Desulfotignum sp.]